MYLLPLLILLLSQTTSVYIKQDVFTTEIPTIAATEPPMAAAITNTLWPLPSSITTIPQNPDLTISPCEINYTVQAAIPQTVQQIISFYNTTIFKCQSIPLKNVTLLVVVRNVSQTVATDLIHQKYSLIIRQNGKWQLDADYFVGFLRGFQTFSQLFEPTTNGQTIIKGIPIVIDDTPQFLWRGLMLDTSRHFIPIQNILKTIDGMLYNKLNVLHWHIIDSENFPMFIPSHPEITQSGALSGIYSVDDVKRVVNYAMTRGVRVVPELDTPAHSASWGRSPQLKDMVIECGQNGFGQFDPTLDLTYNILNDVMIQFNQSFSDNYVHFGGDQVDQNCWNRKPSIKQFMAKNNIANYFELEVYYRKRQKALWRQFSPRKVIYWANSAGLPLDQDDVYHWWGYASGLSQLAGRKNQVILSNYELTYLDVGFGGTSGYSYGTMYNWRYMYSFNPIVPNVNIIGGTACMWMEICNKNTLDQKIWSRSSVIAERLWNTKINISTDLRNIATRLIAQNRRMRERGFKVWSVTVELCEQDPSICF